MNIIIIELSVIRLLVKSRNRNSTSILLLLEDELENYKLCLFIVIKKKRNNCRSR